MFASSVELVVIANHAVTHCTSHSTHSLEPGIFVEPFNVMLRTWCLVVVVSLHNVAVFD